jgi:hypothetical protein
MTREQLEHVIRASAAIAGVEDIVVIGSQSVLGQFPHAPAELLVSREADVYPMRRPERGDLIDGSPGDGSPFERQFGYYAHGVDDTTAILPGGWKDRLVVVSGANTLDARGWCLEVHDLAIAKYVPGRGKDLLFTKGLANHGMTRRDLLGQRLEGTKISDAGRRLAEERIAADFAGNSCGRQSSG